MSEEQQDKPPEDLIVPAPTITTRITETGLVEDVRGYEEIVDEAVARDKKFKVAHKQVEEVKVKLRELVHTRHLERALAGQPQPAATFLHGTSEKTAVEVVESARRKALTPLMAQRALATGLGHLLVTEKTVELSGAMVTWFVGLFGEKDVPGAKHTFRQVLDAKFEVLREQRISSSVISDEEKAVVEELAAGGLYAPAVEVKKLK